MESLEEDRPAWSRRLLLVWRCGAVEESGSCKAWCLHWQQPRWGGPPLTDCWRLELRVLSETTSLSGFSPLCSLPQSTPPSSFSLSPLLPFHCTRYRSILRLNLLHTIPHVHKLKKKKMKKITEKKKTLLTQTQKLCTYSTHGVQRWSASNVPKQMAETNFSLFADSCATSCNKKSMNQGQSIYSNNKEREICHFPTPCFRIFFFNENMPFFLTGTRTQSAHAQRHAISKKKGRIPMPPISNATWRGRHLSVTNQIRSVIEFPISAKLIRKRKHNNNKWHISEGADFKEQRQGIPDASPSRVLT